MKTPSTDTLVARACITRPYLMLESAWAHLDPKDHACKAVYFRITRLDNQNLASNAGKLCGRAKTPKRPKPNEHKDFRAMRVYENEVFQL